jgi:CBS-domain-containing membrane protein
MSDGLHIADVTVGALMTRPVVSLRPDTTIEALTALMAAHPFNGFPVVDELGLLHGLVTRIDLLKRYLVPYRRFIAVLEDTWAGSVSAIMTRHPITLLPVEPAVKAVQLMVDHRLCTIPVVEESTAGARLVGVLTRRDLMPALLD